MAVGTSEVRAELQRGKVVLVVVAGDRSSRTDEKVGRLARARGIPVLVGPGAAALGRQIGRSAIQAVGVRDAQLAAGIRLERRQAEG